MIVTRSTVSPASRRTSTSCCVLNSAFDASNLGYRVSVLSDLVRGTDAPLEAAALSMVSLHLGLVLSSEELAGAWARRSSGAAALR